MQNEDYSKMSESEENKSSSLVALDDNNKINTIYHKTLIAKKVLVNIVNIGKNLNETLRSRVASQIEGKCIMEGYVKPNSVVIKSNSSGLIRGGVNILFDVIIECLICLPVEGMIVKCIAKNITKAGIRAETDENPSPLILFISRDYHNKSSVFKNVKVNDTINVKVIGQKFELNDKFIYVIAEMVEKREKK
jgi:hypothetical protein